jgi:hypothetical protein
MDARGAKIRVGVASRINARRLGGRLAVIAVLAGLLVGVTGGVVLSASPASAALVVNGCTIVQNPTPTNHTNCPSANLSGANLADLNLAYANLSRSNLKAADLSNTNLTQANLSYANLKGAHLGGANLSGANVRSANLQAFFAATVMPNGSINSSGSAITVSPATASVPNGLTQAFDAIATYSDGTSVVLKHNVTWSSSNAQVATVSSTGIAKGVVPNAPYNLANFPKVATITATAGSASGNASLTIGPPNLASIALTPATPAIVVGNPQQFAAAGTYSDGSTTPLAGVTWTSNTPSVATIDTAGLATGVAAGTTTIGASSGIISGSTTLKVVDPLTITTASPLAVGVEGSAYSQALAATGGVGPYTWSKASGAVAPGLTLNADGTITGTPTAAGTFNFDAKADDAGPPAQSDTNAFQIQVNPALGITTTSLPLALTGTSYAQTLQAEGGITPYTWSITQGTLPDGLSLDAGTGQITGTPTTVGSSALTVQVTDSQSPPHSVTKVLSINVAVPLTSVFSAFLGNPVVNQALPASFVPLQVGGGTPPYTWSTTGNVPPGVTVNAATGVLGGTPTDAGTFTFTVHASDAGTPPQTASRTITLEIVQALSIDTASLPDGAVPGQFGCLSTPCYSQTLAGSGGGGPPYQWSVTTGNLPDGLSLDASTGVISGTPSKAGTFLFVVRLSKVGAVITPNPVTKLLSINIAPAPLEIGATFLKTAVTSTPYSESLLVTGGTLPYSWTITGALPAGLTLDFTTGTINGTPTTTGTSPFTIKVTDSTGQSVTKNLSLKVVTPLSVTTTSLPQANLGVFSYEASLGASGGSPGYSWSVVAGNLPPGITLNSLLGTFSGSPSIGGTFTFTVQVADFDFPTPQTATKQLSITAFGISTSSLPAATQGSSYQFGLSVGGGTPPYFFSYIGLPPGLLMNLATGVISGTPTTAGTFAVTFNVCDHDVQGDHCLVPTGTHLRASRTLVMTVAQGVAPLSIPTTSLPNAHQFAPYSAFLGATGGTGPYTWSIISGELPPGMLLDSSTGEIHNAPGVAAVTYNFTVQVTDSGSPQLTATRALSITVDSCFFCGG